MPIPPPETKESVRSPRSDGEQSRERLLLAGLRLFAQHGFTKTSTREIAEAAQVNIAAISYYFGDKAGLYRAVFSGPLSTPADDIARYDDPAMTLPEALAGFYAGFLEPLEHSDMAQQCMRLHVREMLEPTGVWQDEIVNGIKPRQEALIVVLMRHLGLKRVDDEVRRLAICVAALGVHMQIAQDVTDTLAPRLNSQPRALELWSERLVTYALGMVDAEAKRRAVSNKKKWLPRIDLACDAWARRCAVACKKKEKK